MNPGEAAILRSPDVVVDLDGESTVLVVAFGSLLGRMGGIPHFEFMRIMSRMSVKSAFIRDTEARWYHGGVGGVGSTIDALADGLVDLTEIAEAERVVYVGASSGGYAAILFSSIVPADTALTFNPQTFLAPAQRAAAGDERWPEHTMQVGPGLDTRYTDLGPILDERCRPNATPRIEIHFSVTNPYDSAHAQHLAHSPCVRLVPYESGVHGLPGHLKQEGRLEAILSEAISP